MIELKPCPFCGGEPCIYEIEPHTHYIATFMPDYPGSWIIECTGCDVAIMRNKKEEAITAWNRREWKP